MSPGELASTGRHRRLADSDDSDDENQQTVLTRARASELCPKPFRLIAKKQGYTALEDLSVLAELDYIDLTGNLLRSLDGLNGNRRLKTLIVKGNKLQNVDAVLNIAAVRVLDIAENDFVSTEWLPRAAFASDILALMAGGNRLATLDGMASLANLKTLIISNNQIEDISPVTKLSALTKLSASNNNIRVIPGDFVKLQNLCELRMAHNRLSHIPEESVLARLSALKIFDIGHNRITSFENLKACASGLTHVNLRGNPACNLQDDLVIYARSICPQLEVIDGQRVTGGRRKLRVNRQRLEAGFPLEPDRKFARPPPAKYLKETAEKDKAVADQETPDNAKQPTRREVPEKAAVKKRKRPADDPDPGERVIKTSVHSQASSEEDRAIDPEDFLKMAKAKTLGEPRSPVVNGKGAEPKTNGDKAKRQRQRRMDMRKESHPDNIAFGTGSSTQW